jgi:hypothetical protein
MKKLMSAALATGLCFTAASGTVKKTRGHCCRTLARKGFPKVPRNVPGFFHGPSRMSRFGLHWF